MSITDELRKYAQGYKNSHDAWSGIGEELDHIADRIDAEHESACAEAYGNGVESVALLDMTAYVKLPVDADGEIIHVGDMMERGKARGRVIALMLSNYPKKWGGGLHWGVQLEGEHAPTALDLTFHHHHEPTVEDVLFEFAQFWSDEELTDIEHLQPYIKQTLKEYAAKLRLAESEDE